MTRGRASGALAALVALVTLAAWAGDWSVCFAIASGGDASVFTFTAGRLTPATTAPAFIPSGAVSRRAAESRAGPHLNMFARLRNRFEISPHRYAQVTVLALIYLGYAMIRPEVF